MDGSPVQGVITYEVVRTHGPGGCRADDHPGPRDGDTTLTDRGLVNDQAYTYAVRALRTEAGGRARGAPRRR